MLLFVGPLLLLSLKHIFIEKKFQYIIESRSLIFFSLLLFNFTSAQIVIQSLRRHLHPLALYQNVTCSKHFL